VLLVTLIALRKLRNDISDFQTLSTFFFSAKKKVRKEKTLRLHFSPGSLRRQVCDNPQTRCAQTGVATTALPPPAAFPGEKRLGGFK
jgi:hypothetical protein